MKWRKKKESELVDMTVEEMAEHLKKSMPAYYYEASEHTGNHRKEIVQSTVCGCYCCCTTFKPSEITEWVDTGASEFAMCPHCGIDAVLGDKSGYPVDDRKFLVEMNKYWFEGDILPVDKDS